MAYSTYTTEAIVCGSKDSFTSDRSYLLFTERAGMLWATAKSVRTEHSKQRFALQEFSIIRVSLVKGKTGWRIGSVEAMSNPFLRAENRIERGQVQTVIRQLRRFVHGEEPMPEIYIDAVTTLRHISDAAIDLEQLFTLRLLHRLGYIKVEPTFSHLLTPPLEECVTQAMPPLVNAAIERALKVSHL